MLATWDKPFCPTLYNIYILYVVSSMNVMRHICMFTGWRSRMSNRKWNNGLNVPYSPVRPVQPIIFCATFVIPPQTLLQPKCATVIKTLELPSQHLLSTTHQFPNTNIKCPKKLFSVSDRRFAMGCHCVVACIPMPLVKMINYDYISFLNFG